METNIIRIGNSNGLIIPAGILESTGLKTKSRVKIEVSGDSIIIRPKEREGWAAAAKKAHEDGADILEAPDIFPDDINEDLTW